MSAIPKWAYDRAAQLISEHASLARGAGPFSAECLKSVAADTFPPFAAYIAAHEEPPVDPLLIEVRKLVAEKYPNLARDKCHRAFFIAKGEGDFYWETECLLAAIKRGMELARGEEGR